MPRLLPIAVTNSSDNEQIFATFGINASWTLPVVAAIDSKLEARKTVQMKVMQGAFTYANLLQFGNMVKAAEVTMPPAKYVKKDYRVTEPMDFYKKCIEPGPGRCVLYVVESVDRMLDLQQFRDLVMGFTSIK